MPSQHQAEEDLLRTFARLAALLLLLVILAVLGVRYFSAVDQVSARGLQLEHHRLLNVLAMVRSQWLSLGRPEQMQLDWQTLERPEPPGQLAMNKAGWPQAPAGMTAAVWLFGNSFWEACRIRLLSGCSFSARIKAAAM